MRDLLKFISSINLIELAESKIFHFGLILSFIVWIFDPAVDAFLFNENSFIEQLFSAEPVEIYFRSVTTVLILLLAVVSSAAELKIKQAHNETSEERNKLAQLIASTPECVKVVAQDGTLLDMNQAGLDIIEAKSADQVCGQNVYDLMAPEFRQVFIDFNERIFSGQSETIEFEIISLKGTRKTVESHAVPVFDKEGNVVKHLAVTRDVTQSRLLSDQLNYQATHDTLTHLLNRNEFKRRLENALQLSHSDKEQHALLFLDLDQFKVINDTCGHIAGDQVLIQLSGLMKQVVRQQDAIGRMGGDEFAILLLGCSTKESETIAEKLRSLIEDYSFPWEDRHFKLSTSIGLVTIDDAYQSINPILRDADSACFMAKDRGRNRIQHFQSSDETLFQQQGDMHWVAKIHEGIAQNRFVLFCQSIQGLNEYASQQRMEILLRYQDDDGNVLPPGAFLPAAERFGISAHIDRYVINASIAYLIGSPSLLDKTDSFAINLSGLSIADEKFLDFSIKQLSAHPDIACKICFEITETAAINNLNNAQRFIEELRQLGCQFALDDFGSGLSSFAYLKTFPVDIVKIDGLFVRDIVDDPIDLAMVRSINEIAQLMGKKTVAEFVENEQIKSQLQLIGVDFVQGYGIHKPCPISELITSEKNVSSV